MILKKNSQKCNFYCVVKTMMMSWILKCVDSSKHKNLNIFYRYCADNQTVCRFVRFVRFLRIPTSGEYFSYGKDKAMNLVFLLFFKKDLSKFFICSKNQINNEDKNFFSLYTTPETQRTRLNAINYKEGNYRSK